MGLGLAAVPLRLLGAPGTPRYSAWELTSATAYDVHQHCVMGVDEPGPRGLIGLLQMSHRWEHEHVGSLAYDAQQQCIMGVDHLGGAVDTGLARREARYHCAMVVDDEARAGLIRLLQAPGPKTPTTTTSWSWMCSWSEGERPAGGPHDAWMPARNLTSSFHHSAWPAG